MLLLIFILSIRNTSLFDLQVFALSLVAAVIAWITTQAVLHARSKTLYVDPDADTRNRPGGAGGDRDE
ncbi:ATP synthase protein I OS=Streptomyces microflavus OX=1919 GN=atpI PE=4 SV=1 [Streptomyces microflavus]